MRHLDIHHPPHGGHLGLHNDRRQPRVDASVEITLIVHFLKLREISLKGRSRCVIFSESPACTKAVQVILREEDYFELQDQLIDAPDVGGVIPGSKGLRKLRVASGGKGKRGGSRVIYYWYVDPETHRLAQAREWKAKTEAARIRRDINITQDAFARMLGVSLGTVRKWERGTIQPSGAARTLLKIAAKYPAIVREAAMP